jgi:HPt (histidine-containing phosphotransfer) domain-containing protein
MSDPITTLLLLSRGLAAAQEIFPQNQRASRDLTAFCDQLSSILQETSQQLKSKDKSGISNKISQIRVFGAVAQAFDSTLQSRNLPSLSPAIIDLADTVESDLARNHFFKGHHKTIDEIDRASGLIEGIGKILKINIKASEASNSKMAYGKAAGAAVSIATAAFSMTSDTFGEAIDNISEAKISFLTAIDNISDATENLSEAKETITEAAHNLAESAENVPVIGSLLRSWRGRT